MPPINLNKVLHKGIISEESKAKREIIRPVELPIAANTPQAIPCLILILLIAEGVFF